MTFHDSEVAPTKSMNHKTSHLEPDLPEDEREMAALRIYFDLYVRGNYYECHDVIEELWLEMGARRRTFYQGLLQCAVARHHAEKGNLHGARILYRDGTAKLEPYRPKYMGVDVEKFIEELKEGLPVEVVGDAGG